MCMPLFVFVVCVYEYGVLVCKRVCVCTCVRACMWCSEVYCIGKDWLRKLIGMHLCSYLD